MNIIIDNEIDEEVKWNKVKHGTLETSIKIKQEVKHRHMNELKIVELTQNGTGKYWGAVLNWNYEPKI